MIVSFVWLSAAITGHQVAAFSLKNPALGDEYNYV